MEFMPFASFEEMMAHIEEQNKRGRDYMTENKIDPDSLKSGFWKLVEEDLVIYGEASEGVLDRDEYETEDEYVYEVESLECSRADGYIFGTWYSMYLPEGEYGSNHISRCQAITEEEFNEAKEQGWMVE